MINPAFIGLNLGGFIMNYHNKSAQFYLISTIFVICLGCAKDQPLNEKVNQEQIVKNSTDDNTNNNQSNKPIIVEHTPVDVKQAKDKQQTGDSSQANSGSVINDVITQEAIISPAVNTREKLSGQITATSAIRKTKQSYQRAVPSLINMTAPISHHIKTIERERYPQLDENSVKLVSESPVSTFSIDVDTASYSNMRRHLNQGKLPVSDAVRVEEFINYFSYNYPEPKQDKPFALYTEIAPSPYNADKHILHLGIQGKRINADTRPPSNLVFLIDVSGSMRSANKLGLLKNALKLLAKQLDEKDKVAIVVYAGAAGTVLKPTSGKNHYAISQALDNLSAGGSTHGSAGIESAYQLAESVYINDGINRVILATDGDFNVGTTNQRALKQLISTKRKKGIELSVLGFGAGNYNDAVMQELAQNGNGNAYYIDTLQEARKVLVEELSATLVTIAKDVKIQVEFNPNNVREYRLLGYETRMLNREDFNNDKVDAGEIGAGHTVTAIYELSLQGSNNQQITPLRYEHKQVSQHESINQAINADEIAYLRLRYKAPKGQKSQLVERAITHAQMAESIEQSSADFKFSAAVAGYAQILRGGENLSTMDLSKVITLAEQATEQDKFGYKHEFIQLVKLAKALSQETIKETLATTSNNRGSIAKVGNHVKATAN